MDCTEGRSARELHARADTAGAGDPAHGWTFARAAAHERAEVERFIAARFAQTYGARLRRFFPVLMRLRHRDALIAACGVRRAAAEPLFLEAYLDRPIEHVLTALAGEPVERRAIVEVGNLAVARAGYARRLIVALTLDLEAAGAGWSVFSAVPALRNNFARLGIPLVPLAPAEQSRLAPAERRDWGSYYDSAPQVSAVRVAAAFACLDRGPCTR